VDVKGPVSIFGLADELDPTRDWHHSVSERCFPVVLLPNSEGLFVA
jgi:hypothetical protein